MAVRHRLPLLPEARVVVAQPLGDELVLRREAAVQRHLGGVGLGGDRLHADGADALAVKEIRGGVEDALACVGAFGFAGHGSRYR